MAIYAYYGKPGSGKSYSVVANVIKPALVEGRHVYTNIPLTEKAAALGGKITHFENDVTVEYFAGIDKGSILVIDEAWRFCPAGERTTAMPESWREFLAMHRHMVNEAGQSTQIYFVSQGAAQLNTFVKGLIDTAYVITKKSGLGITKFRTEVFSGETATAARGRYDNAFFSSYDAANYALYNSSTMSDSGGVGDEKVLDSRGGIGNNPMIKYGFPLAIGLVIFGIYNAYSYFQSFGASDEVEESPVQSLPVPTGKSSGLARSPAIAPAVPVVSADMKVTGYGDYKKGMVVVHIQHANGYTFDWDASLCAQYMRSYKCVIDGLIVSPISGKNVRDLDDGSRLAAAPIPAISFPVVPSGD